MYVSDNEETNLALDGSGKANHNGQRLWRFSCDDGEANVGAEVLINGRRARIVESSTSGGYVEFLEERRA
ncbi:MAG: hypothetical protein KDE51_08525 [Anaerolineales bacterium]|nr:hypothetical protein [Anaerolineales bacterium]